MENKINNLERIGMEQKALALPYSEDDIKQYFQKKEHLSLKVINLFIEENKGKLYFDIANRPIGINGKNIYRNLFGIFDKENENKFLDLMKYANPDLSSVAHMIYSKEAEKRIFKKMGAIYKNLENKGGRFAIYKLSQDLYQFINIDNKGFLIEDRDIYILRIKNKSKILNERWFRNERKIYEIEDIVY